MEMDKKDLIDILNSSVRELRQWIDEHFILVTSILEGQVDECNLQHVLNLCPTRVLY